MPFGLWMAWIMESAFGHARLGFPIDRPTISGALGTELLHLLLQLAHAADYLR
jgi:hypothetical protein